MKTINDYAQLVKKEHAMNKTIAPVETNASDASQSYAIGEQFILDGILRKAKTAIAQHDALVYNTNYEDADDIVTQIKNHTVTTDAVPTEGSTNPVESNGVYVANQNIYAVNGKMGAKALLPISLADIKAKNTTGTWNNNAYAINGVTFTVNTDSDGFITDIAATGTASADATLMVYGYSYTSSYAVTYDTPVIASIDFVGSDSTVRGIVWGTNSSYIEATEVQIPAGTIYGFGLRVLNGYEIPVGGITFKPMIRFASDTDATYQPYVKTNKELTAENDALTKKLEDEAATRSVMSAKNLLPFDLDAIKDLNTAGTWASNVYSYRGVDFTVNPDGTILADGQATGGNASIKVFAATSSYEMRGKNVILNGCPSGGSATTYRIQAYRMGSVDGSSGTYFDDGDGTVAFDALNNASGTVGSFAVAVYENYDADNLLFKPMVRLSTDSDGTYQPYAKTNKELTDDVSSLNSALTNKLEVKTITNISQIPNSDLKSLPTGMYLIQGSVMNNSNLIDAPFVDDSAIGLTILTHPDGYILYEAVPLNFEKYPIYTGRYYSVISPHIQWGAQPKTPNRNLLDNPWFTINQRGISGAVSAALGYDRWYGNYSYNANGVALAPTGYLIQNIEADIKAFANGKVFTASVMLSDGTIYSGTAVYSTSEDVTWISNSKLSCGSGSYDGYAFSVTAIDDIVIRAIKFELGTVSTLAQDGPPDYGEELLKCQRYFYIIKNNNLLPVFNGFAAGSSRAQVTFNNPVQMRTAPTAVASSDLKFTIRHGSTKEDNVTAGTVTAYADGNNQFNLLDFNTLSISTLTQNELLSVAITSGNISFSADI